MRAFWTALAVVLLPSVSAGQQKQVIQLPGTPPGLPFSTAVRVGDVLYLSGQIGTSPETGQLVPGGIRAETRQTLENIKRTLEQIGSSMDRVFKCTVFLADMADYAAMNEVYRTYFPVDPPARSTVAGSGLAFGARVEIECLALAGK
ncbi:MAG: reactive intermediate/imine deaminase [Gemmatimonadales bacterium]|nr:MAG: reactive intermediate/imine deaminase [Gemmatimonadales bacterium]